MSISSCKLDLTNKKLILNLQRTIELNNQSLFNDHLMNDSYIPRILYKIRELNQNSQSDVNIVDVVFRESLPSEEQVVKDMSKNEVGGSTKPFLNFMTLQTNYTSACYIYISQNFTHPVITISGEYNKLYCVYFLQNNNAVLQDILTSENNIIKYGTKLADNICPKCKDCKDSECPRCPEQVRCDSCCPRCPEPVKCDICPDTRGYEYGLYACITVIFLLLSYIVYSMGKYDTSINKR